jgi:hypothetical protein
MKRLAAVTLTFDGNTFILFLPENFELLETKEERNPGIGPVKTTDDSLTSTLSFLRTYSADSSIELIALEVVT